MLSKEHNDLLTQSSAGTPLGDFLRRYWLPALLTEEIPTADGPPVQVRMLGEELVAFRDSEGRVGLLGEHCAHRGTSLFYGRNEECGLRCIYHGWKYDVDGNVLDTPAEPGDSTFHRRLKHLSYPTREAGGMVFAYLGPREKQPIFPDYYWTGLAPEYTYVTKCLLECNYLQGLEGECDSSHLSFLHRFISSDELDSLTATDTAPRYEIEETDFGLRLIALRSAGPESTYVRVSSFVAPVSCWIPARGKEVHMYVPADDTHAWRYDFGFRADRPVRPEEVERRPQIGPDFRKIRNLDNHYLQDREVQRRISFTGIESFLNHDAAATETMGAIYDREREHLGASDRAVIAVRHYLIDAIKAFQQGEEPPHVVTHEDRNHFAHVDTFAEVVEGAWRSHYPHLTRAVDPTVERVETRITSAADGVSRRALASTSGV